MLSKSIFAQRSWRSMFIHCNFNLQAYSFFGRPAPPSVLNQRLIIRNMGKTVCNSRDIFDSRRKTTHQQRLNAFKETEGGSSSSVTYLNRIPSASEKKNVQQEQTLISKRRHNSCATEFKENSHVDLRETLNDGKLYGKRIPTIQQRLTTPKEFEGLEHLPPLSNNNKTNVGHKILQRSSSVSNPLDLRTETEKPIDLRELLNNRRNRERSDNMGHKIEHVIITSRSKPLNLQKETEKPIKEISPNHAEKETLTKKVESLSKAATKTTRKKKNVHKNSPNNAKKDTVTKKIKSLSLGLSKLSMNYRLAAVRGNSETKVSTKSVLPPKTLKLNTNISLRLENASLCRPNYSAQQRHLVTKSNPEESINNNDENLLTSNGNPPSDLPKDIVMVDKNEAVKHVSDNIDDTKSINTSIEPIQIKVDNSSEIQTILQKYPSPKNTLHNFYKILSEELKDVSLECSPTYKYVQLKNKTSAWTCTYRIKWPMNYEISATEKTKLRASAFAACKTLLLLSQHGKLSPEGSPLIYSKEEVKKISKQKQTKVEFDKYTIQNMENIIQVFNNNMLPTINSTNFTDYKEQSNAIVTGESNFLSKEPQFLGNSRYLAKEKIILPISAYKEEFMELLLNNNCVIVKGEPGCGKSSRVPQYVLESWIRDHASSSNQLCRIAVTQPRRIAAISLANRVASERNEEVGHIVGYQVRLKSNFDPRTGRIIYCTTGILMRQIQSDPHLTKFSHVILDEAHERDVNTDILMNMLKIAIERNKSLKVVVMSATIDTETFSDYFDGAPILNIPGFSYPVEKFYLDKVESAKSHPKTLKMCQSGNPEVVHEEVAALLKYIHKMRPEGAILVFLPGWDDLMKVQKHMSPSQDVVVHLVHSKLKDSEQYKIFSKPPPGVRKIILATNIAETSITIDDVVYVVDTGMHKDNVFDIKKGINVIDMEWISKASSNQRAGRAGRCSPGESYHLYTKDKYEEFEDYSSPKILNSSLTRVVLESKVFANNMNAGDFMNSLITPPEKAAVQKAVDDLKQLELLDDNEKLTPLGRTLVDFQLEPGLAKAMVNSVVFKCTTPIVDIITLFSSETNLFGSNSLIDQKSIKDVKSAYCKSSDHLALMRVYEKWLELNEEDPHSAERFCRNTNLVSHRLDFVDKLKNIHYGYLQNGLYNVLPLSDKFSDNDELVKAVLYSGTGTVLEHRNWDIVKNRLKTNVNVLVTRNNHKASIGQESVNFKRHKFPTNFMVYMNETRSNIRRTTIVRECSLIPAISVLLFNNKELKMLEPDSRDTISDNLVIIGIKNTKLQFLCDKEHASLLLECKRSIDLSYKYLIHQMTYTGENNPEILQNWDQILEELNKILLRHKVA